MDVNEISLNNLIARESDPPRKKPATPAQTNARARNLVLAGIQSASPQQRERWRNQGKCIRCGDPTHWVQECFAPPIEKKLVTWPYESDESDWEYG